MPMNPMMGGAGLLGGVDPWQMLMMQKMQQGQGGQPQGGQPIPGGGQPPMGQPIAGMAGAGMAGMGLLGGMDPWKLLMMQKMMQGGGAGLLSVMQPGQ